MSAAERPRILVVDDAPVTCVWVQAVLESAGFEVVTTDNPVLVSSMIFRGGFRLVLLDVSMPLLSGDRVAAIMKGASVRPIILLHSSREPTELQALVESCGADGYVVKTSDPKRFLADIKTYLDHIPDAA